MSSQQNKPVERINKPTGEAASRTASSPDQVDWGAIVQTTSNQVSPPQVPQGAVAITAAIREWREAHHEFIVARVACVPFERKTRAGTRRETGEEERVQSEFRKALYRLMAASDPILGLCATYSIDSRAIRRRVDNPRNGDLSTSNEADYVVAELEARLQAQTVGGSLDPTPPADVAHPAIVLQPEDKKILNVLAKRNTTVFQFQLEVATDISRRSIGRRLRKLREAGLTHRPNGEQGGESITDAGLKALAPRSRAKIAHGLRTDCARFSHLR